MAFFRESAVLALSRTAVIGLNRPMSDLTRPRQRAATHGGRPRKRTWATPLADLVGPCIEPAVARRGFAAADLVLFWADIVGERLAAACEPIKLQWPPRARDRSLDLGAQAATLMVRVEGAFALELQHVAAVVVERINAHLGWRCVAKLALRQSPLRRANVRRQAARPPDAAATVRGQKAAAAIDDEGLRAAVARLGAQVYRKSATDEGG